MTTQFKTGPAMQQHLVIHNIPAANVTRHRDGIFTAEFFQHQAMGEAISSKHAVEPPTNYANQIINALGGVRIVDTHETIATWTAERVRLDATVKFVLVEPIEVFTGYFYMGNFGEVVTILSEPTKWSVKPSAKVAEYRKPMLFGQTTMFPYGTFQIVK